MSFAGIINHGKPIKVKGNDKKKNWADKTDYGNYRKDKTDDYDSKFDNNVSYGNIYSA